MGGTEQQRQLYHIESAPKYIYGTQSLLSIYERFTDRLHKGCTDKKGLGVNIAPAMDSPCPATTATARLTPPSRAPPETLPLFAGKEAGSTLLNQHGRQRVVTGAW